MLSLRLTQYLNLADYAFGRFKGSRQGAEPVRLSDRRLTLEPKSRDIRPRRYCPYAWNFGSHGLMSTACKQPMATPEREQVPSPFASLVTRGVVLKPSSKRRDLLKLKLHYEHSRSQYSTLDPPLTNSVLRPRYTRSRSAVNMSSKCLYSQKLTLLTTLVKPAALQPRRFLIGLRQGQHSTITALVPYWDRCPFVPSTISRLPQPNLRLMTEMMEEDITKRERVRMVREVGRMREGSFALRLPPESVRRLRRCTLTRCNAYPLVPE